MGMTGIGNHKAFRIWFDALRTGFTGSTNYYDAYSKVLASAKKLYGDKSAEAVAVKRAYAAINVGWDVHEIGQGINITAISAPRTLFTGSLLSMVVSIDDNTVGPYSYQWLKDGKPIPGATGSSYSKKADMSDNGAVFSVVITDSATPRHQETGIVGPMTVYDSGCLIGCLR